ncbi:ribosomal protein L7/L12 [Kitasatospora acidiphila]|uniref:ribosomal protein L7/L12 n=1 Tax=Kitasatospora acidiphila TaxID=2567942 RepID=UPI003C787AC8
MLRNVDKATAVAAQRVLAHAGATAVVTSREPGPWIAWQLAYSGVNRLQTPRPPTPQPEKADRYVVLTRIGRDRSAVVKAVSDIAGLPLKEARKIAGRDPRHRIVLRNVDKATAVAAQRVLAHAGATAVVTSREPGPWFPYWRLVLSGVVCLLFGAGMTTAMVLTAPDHGGQSINGFTMVGVGTLFGGSGALGLVLLTKAFVSKSKEDYNGYLRPGEILAVVGLGIVWTLILVIYWAQHYP